MKETIIKLLIAGILLGCLAKVPYGYFQFVRISTCIGFAYLCYVEFEAKRSITGILCLGAAILLNPVYKISFKRGLWNQIDIGLAALLVIWIIVDLIIDKKIMHK